MHRTEVGWRIKFPLLGLTFALEFTTALAAVFGCVFLTNTVLLDLDKAAWVEGILRVVAAVNNPLVLLASDFNTSIYGRRRIYLLSACLPYAVVSFLTWVKVSQKQWLQLTYLLIIKFACYLLHSMLHIPQIALISEIMQNPMERLKFHRLRAVASHLGWLACIGTLAAVGSYYNGNQHYVPESDSENYRLFMASGLGSLLTVLFAFWTFRVTSSYTTSFRNWEHLLPEVQHLLIELAKMLLRLFQVREYLFSMLQYTVATAAFWATLMMLPYYLSSYKGQHFEEVASFITVAIMAALVLSGVIIVISRCIERTTLFTFGCLVWLIFHLILLLDGRASDPTPFTIILGIGGAAAITIPMYLMGDSSHFVEWKLKQRSEALLMGTADSIRQALLGVIIFIFQMVMSTSSYTNSAFMKDRYRQPESALKALKYMISFVPMFLIIISLVLNFFSPVTAKSVHRVLVALRRRRRQAAALQNMENGVASMGASENSQGLYRTSNGTGARGGYYYYSDLDESELGDQNEEYGDDDGDDDTSTDTSSNISER